MQTHDLIKNLAHHRARYAREQEAMEAAAGRLGTTKADLEKLLEAAFGDTYFTAEWLDKLSGPKTLAKLQARVRGIEARTRRHLLDRAVPGVTLAQLDPAKLEQLVPPKLKDIATDYTPADGGLLIVGPTGIGKSATMAFIARRLVLASGRVAVVAWAPARAIATARRSFPLGQGEPEALVRAEDAGLLFLDDLGWESDATDVLAVLAGRYDSGKPTIVSSGLTQAELATKYGGAVVRRIIESGGARGRLADLFPRERV